MLPERPLVKPRAPVDGQKDDASARDPDTEDRLDQEVEQRSDANRTQYCHDFGPRFPDRVKDAHWKPSAAERHGPAAGAACKSVMPARTVMRPRSGAALRSAN